MLDKVKDHVKEHKEVYIAGTCVVVGCIVGIGVTLILTKNMHVTHIAKNTALFQWRPTSTNTTTTQLVRQGHPGNMTLVKETGVVFPSQSAAAKAMGVDQANVVHQLNGRIPHVSGFTFERLGEMA